MTLSVPRTCTPRMCEEARRHRRHSARARRRSTGRTRAAPSPSTCRGRRKVAEGSGERATRAHRMCIEGALRVYRVCIEGSRGPCGGAVRRGHRVRGGAEAAAERLVVVVVGVVHRVGLREVGRTAAWGVQQLGGHHLYRQRACTVHAVCACGVCMQGTRYAVHMRCTASLASTVPAPSAPPRRCRRLHRRLHCRACRRRHARRHRRRGRPAAARAYRAARRSTPTGYHPG